MPTDTRNYLEKQRKQFLNPEKIRSPSVYVGLGEEKPFFIEKSPPLIMTRLKHNFKYFYLNYLIISIILFLLTLLVTPTAVFGIGAIIALWFFTLKATESGSVTVRGVTIPQKPILVVLTVVSFFILSCVLSNIFWWTLFSSFLCGGGHAFFRDATMHIDEEDKVSMVGEIDEDADFVNGSGHKTDLV